MDWKKALIVSGLVLAGGAVGRMVGKGGALGLGLTLAGGVGGYWAAGKLA